MPRRLSELGRMVAVAVFATASLLAATARGEGEPGQFTWRPSLKFTSVADDNVFFEPGSRDGSVGFWIAPRMELAYRTPALDLGADLGVDFRRYLDHTSDLAAELYRAVGHAEVGLRPGLTLRVSNAYVPQPRRLGLPDDEAINLVQTNRADADLRWWHELPGGRELEAGFRTTHFWTEDYHDMVPQGGGVFLADGSFNASYLQGLGFVELQSPVGVRSSVYVRGQASYREFSDISSADHSNLSLLFGLRSNRWSDADIELAGGVGALGFDGFADALRALGRVGVRWRLPNGWTVDLAAQHLLTADIVAKEVSETTGHVGVEKRFGPATAASVKVFLTRFDGDSWNGVNLSGGAELLLRRQLTRFLQLAVGYRHWRDDGDFGLDARQNRVSLELQFRYQPR